MKGRHDAAPVTVVAGGLSIKRGVVSVGGYDAMNCPAGDVVFKSGTILKVSGDLSGMALSQGKKLEICSGARLDLSNRSLLVENGEVKLCGTMIVGLSEPDDPAMVTFLGVDDGIGVVTITDTFQVILTEALIRCYADDPVSTIEDTSIIDAVIRHDTLPEGRVWKTSVPTPYGLFKLSAQLGASPDSGGGLLLNF